MSLSMHTPTVPHHHHHTHNALQTPPNISGLQQHSQQQQACWINNINHAGNSSTAGTGTLLQPNSVTPQCPGGNNFAVNSSTISSGGTAQHDYMPLSKPSWDASSAHNSGLSKKGNVLKSPEINNGQQRHGKNNNTNTNSILNSQAPATSHSSSTHRPSWKERPHVGRYSLIRTIGKGNFAKVKLAQHLTTGIQVAVKVIDKSRLSQSSMQKLFREVRVLKTLNHPNIVKLLEVIESERHLYLVMEYASGGEVFDYLVRHGRMKEGDARAKFRQIISAVQYCHQKMVVHRDLKAENLLLDADLNIKIADFGFSNYYSSVQKLDTFCGSPPYAAPELFLGRRYEGPEVDIWSLGVILYTLVSGTLPFDGKNLKELRERVLRGTYRVPFYMTRECEMLLRKMLILNPTKRQPLVDVMRDSWLNSGSDNPLRPYVEPAVDQYDSDRIEAMVRMGFQRSDIHDALTNQRFNNITATYILLARNNNRTGGRLPCANGGGGLTHVDQSRKSGQPVSRQHSARLPSAINEQQQPATMTVVVPSCGADAGGVPSELVGISTVSSTSTASSSCLIRPATASAEVGAGQSPVIGGNKAAQAGGDLPTMATTTGPRNEPVRRRSSTTTVVTNLTNQQSTPPSPSCSERPGGTPTAGNANSVSPPPSQPPPVETMTASHLASAITIHPKFSASPPPLSSAPLAHEEKEADDSCSSIKVSRRRSSAGSSSVTVVTQNHPTEWKQQQQQPPFPVVNGWKVSDASRSSSTSSDSSSNSCSTAASASLRPGATVLASSPVTVCSVTLAAAPHTPSTKFGIHDQVTNVTPGTTSTTPYATPSLAFTRMGSVRRNPSSVTVRAKEFDAPRCTASPAAATTMPRTAFASATSSVASSGASASRFPRVASTSVQQHDRTTIDSSPGHVERLNALLTAGGGGNTTGEPKSYRHLQAYENAESSVTRTPSCFFRPPPSAADILSDTNPFRLVVPVAGSAADHSPACTGPPSIPPHKTRAAFAVATPTGPIQTFSPNSARHQQTSDSQPLVATANSAAVRRPTAPTPPPLAIPLVNNQTVPSRNSYLYHSLRLPSSTCSHNVIEELVNSRHSCNRDARKPSTLSAALPDVYTPVPFVRNLPERSTIQHVPSGRARQRLEEAVGTTGRLVRHAGRQSIATHSIRLRANPLPTTSITTVKNDSSNATSHNHFCSNAGDEDIDDADLVVVTPRAVSPIDADTISLSSDSTAASSTSTSMSTLAQHQQHSAAVAGASRFRRQDMSPDRSAPLAAAGRQHRSLTKPVRGATVGRGGSSPPTSSQQQPMHRHYSMRPASGSTVNSSNVTKSPGTIHGERTVGGGAGINHFFRTLTTRISRSRLFRRSTIIQTNNGYSSNNEYAPGLDVSPIVAHSRHDPKMAPTFELDKVVALTATAREASPSSGPTGMLHAPVGGGHMPRSRSGVATTHHQLQRAGFGLANPVDRGAANELSSSRTQADFTEAARTSGTRRPSQRSFRTPPGNGPAASTATQSMKTSSHCNLSAESREQHPSRFTPGNDDNHGRFPKSEEASYLGGSNRVGTHQSMRYVLRSNSTHFSLQDVMMDVQQSLSKHGVDFELIGDMKLHCVYGDPSQDCRVPTLTNGMKSVKQMLPPSGDAQNLNDSVVHWEMEIGKLVGVSVNGIRFKRINGPMHILRHIVNKIASDMKL